MTDIIKCPVCGEDNFDDQELCQSCNSRLHPNPVTPGQAPTKKNTAELEPILPQWLRDARDQSRQSAGLDSPQNEELNKQQMPPEVHASSMDLLAGLHSQSEDDAEEETPDWLASITGANNKSKKAAPESSEARRVELGSKNDFAQNTPEPVRKEEDDTPDWLASLQAQQPTENDELNTWFNQAQSSTETNPPQAESPNWFQESNQKDALSESAADLSTDNDGTLDWLRQMDTDDRANNNDMPAWMSQNDQPASSLGSDSDMPSWLNAIGSEDKSQSESPADLPTPTFGATDAGFSSASETPDWLKNLDSGASVNAEQPEDVSPAWLKDESGADDQGDVPSWLSSDAPAPQPEPSTSTDDADFGEIPSWLKAAAPQSSVYSEPAAEQHDSPAPEEGTDWLAAFKSDSVESVETPSASAFADASFDDGGAEALMNDIPDWLANATEPSGQTSNPTPITNADAISPGELPSWVQAMRPVDPGASQPARGLSSDQTLETRGALSGLQGVLPSAPGYAPSSKPKAYSIKLQTTDEQQAQALLLEQILSAEAEPEPIASYSPLIASRGLRWFIAFAVFGLVFAVTILRTQIFALPFLAVNTPNELQGALNVAQTVSDSGNVLVVVDYQPSRAGELETAAVPMLDQMDLLHHPRLIFVSTHETGSMLADRLMKLDVMKERYQTDVQAYVNLGYLPGGAMGIRSFIQNPQQAMTYDASLNPAPLNDIASFSQFAAVIVMTDNAESGRSWVEQLTAVKNVAPLMLITSAQASPMLQPYYASGQVNGIVSGLYGGAVFEQNNANRPGTSRTYWDAYSVGMLLATLLVVGGGLLSFILGLRDRAAGGDGT